MSPPERTPRTKDQVEPAANKPAHRESKAGDAAAPARTTGHEPDDNGATPAVQAFWRRRGAASGRPRRPSRRALRQAGRPATAPSPSVYARSDQDGDAQTRGRGGVAEHPETRRRTPRPAQSSAAAAPPRPDDEAGRQVQGQRRPRQPARIAQQKGHPFGRPDLARRSALRGLLRRFDGLARWSCRR